MPYLSKRALSGLRDYKYKPAGYTYMDAAHQPFWNYITEHILPPWLAPNLVTLTGLSALIAAYAITAAYLPDFENPAPRWLYFMAGTAVFFYLHMDALDGKQARRTKTSSPLGQLFDHGCDALAVHLILVTMATSLQMRHEWKTIVSLMYVFIPWWMAHWEEYHTGVMVYGSGLWGVTEANYAVVLVHYYTVVVGPKGWTTRILAGAAKSALAREYLPAAALKIIGNLQVNEIFLFLFSFCGIGLFIQQVTRVVSLAGSRMLERTTLPKKEQGHKTLGKKMAIFHLAQILLTCVIGAALLSLPVYVRGQSRVIIATFGVTYALQATRLVMAHMSKEPFHVAPIPLALMGLQILNYFVPFTDPVGLTYLVNATIVAIYLHYVVNVIHEICAFLGIRAFTIKTAKD